ncbi:unnamed protein product [Calypogeia fissa]
MNAKYLFATVLLVASTTLLLAPTIEGCVVFTACYYRGPNVNPNQISISLFDNNLDTPICSLNPGLPGNDGQYTLQCGSRDGSISASWNPNSFLTTYKPAPDRGTYTFQNSAPSQPNGVCSCSCDFGCDPDQCFIQGSGECPVVVYN